MSTVAITADIHFGIAGRLNDCLWACRVIREYCRAADIDVVLVLGDLFHDRSNISIDVLVAVCRFFEETQTEYGQHWIAFPGNHDMFLRHSWSVNSLIPLRRHLTVIDDIRLLTLNDYRFWILPFVALERPYLKLLRAIEKKSHKDDVLLTHIGVRGASYNTCFTHKDWSIIDLGTSQFDRVYAGHFHNRQQVGQNVWYPGSPIPFKFDEGDISHGFYVYDMQSRNHKFINIWKAGARFLPDEEAPPQFCTFLDDESLASKSEADVKGNIIRVALQREYSMEDKRQIRDRLLALGARAIRWLDLSQRLPQQPASVTMSQRNLFQAWLDIDADGWKGLDKNVLIKVNDDVVREGDELYAIEEDVE